MIIRTAGRDCKDSGGGETISQPTFLLLKKDEGAVIPVLEPLLLAEVDPEMGKEHDALIEKVADLRKQQKALCDQKTRLVTFHAQTMQTVRQPDLRLKEMHAKLSAAFAKVNWEALVVLNQHFLLAHVCDAHDLPVYQEGLDVEKNKIKLKFQELITILGKEIQTA